MIKELNDRDKLLKLNSILDEFLDNDDCSKFDCRTCKHKRICDFIYRLDTTLSVRYLKR
ncbi:hypothetical protein G4W71_17855 [Clostridium botulinum]|uniref:hypothetical protein n=1 Tax=Clostridium botulinum TaxID=1491 RepID=UPI001788A76E|nr:hypothetical protein [Clostridium botulinum]MBE1305872.1 hypothetical protein [Clostridium botulinum]